MSFTLNHFEKATKIKFKTAWWFGTMVENHICNIRIVDKHNEKIQFSIEIEKGKWTLTPYCTEVDLNQFFEPVFE